MTTPTYTICKLSAGEKIALKRRIEHKIDSQGCISGRCAACNKMLEDSEQSIRGYGSGELLGLCRKCASYVNTDQAIMAAERLGFRTYARAIAPVDVEEWV